MITREVVVEKIRAYLHHEIPLEALVDWAESAMMEGEFDERDHDDIRDVVARIGLADVRAFGLTWDDCEQLLKTLGYSTRVEIVMA
ncbi:MAG: hypothetical protein AB1546_04980 [bacterium]